VAVRSFYSVIMIYLTILTAVFLAISIARIVFLNKEIKTLDKAGLKFQTPSGSVDLAKGEAETEHSWLLNERDSKKESRTIWYGIGLFSAITFMIALSLLIGKSH
jgi:hypothetical protein